MASGHAWHGLDAAKLSVHSCQAASPMLLPGAFEAELKTLAWKVMFVGFFATHSCSVAATSFLA